MVKRIIGPKIALKNPICLKQNPIPLAPAKDVEKKATGLENAQSKALWPKNKVYVINVEKKVIGPESVHSSRQNHQIPALGVGQQTILRGTVIRNLWPKRHQTGKTFKIRGRNLFKISQKKNTNVSNVRKLGILRLNVPLINHKIKIEFLCVFFKKALYKNYI